LISLSILLFLLSIKPILSYAESIDKGNILIDKVASFLLVLTFCPYSDDWIWMIIAVIVYLIFNQMKLFPRRLISGKRGLVGIFGDGIIIGIYTILTMHLFYSAFQVIGLITTLGMKY
jgi:phosphatidylglycerophosphatase A